MLWFARFAWLLTLGSVYLLVETTTNWISFVFGLIFITVPLLFLAIGATRIWFYYWKQDI